MISELGFVWKRRSQKQWRSLAEFSIAPLFQGPPLFFFRSLFFLVSSIFRPYETPTHSKSQEKEPLMTILLYQNEMLYYKDIILALSSTLVIHQSSPWKLEWDQRRFRYLPCISLQFRDFVCNDLRKADIFLFLFICFGSNVPYIYHLEHCPFCKISHVLCEPDDVITIAPS